MPLSPSPGRRRATVALLQVALLAAACSSTAPAADPGARIDELELPVAPEWAGDAVLGDALREPFWHSFDEPALSVVVEEALEHNRDLAASAARLEAAAARARIARSVRYPALDATGGWSRRKQIFVGLPIPGSSQPLESLSTSWDVGVQASWEVDLWGRLKAGAQAADASFAAFAADHAAAQLAVAAQTVRAWFGARGAQLQVELAERTRETYARTAEVIEDRFDAGLVGALDLRLANANLRTSEANLVAARRS